MDALCTRCGSAIVRDELRLELGEALLTLAGPGAGALAPRIGGVRDRLCTELGFPFPPLHIVDASRLNPDGYRVLLRGVELAGGRLRPDGVMVLDPSGAPPAVEGEPGVEPAFGMPMVWAAAALRAEAEARGYTTVDPLSALVTHLEELVRRHAHLLLSVDGTAALLDACRAQHPRLVDEAVPARLSLPGLTELLRGLLRERVPVQDLATILEAVATSTPPEPGGAALLERARLYLRREVTACVAVDGAVHACTLTPTQEAVLRAALRDVDGAPALVLGDEEARALLDGLSGALAGLDARGLPRVLIAPAELRAPLFDFTGRFLDGLFVLAPRELAPGLRLVPLSGGS